MPGEFRLANISVTPFGSPPAQDALLHLHFDSSPMAVSGVIETILSAIRAERTVSNADQSNIEIVLAEIINNICEHAYRGDPTGPIEATVIPQADAIEFRLTDKGRSMPRGALPSGAPQDLNCDSQDLPEGGFGWLLIHRLAQRLGYSRENGENRLRFEIRLSDSSSLP